MCIVVGVGVPCVDPYFHHSQLAANIVISFVALAFFFFFFSFSLGWEPIFTTNFTIVFSYLSKRGLFCHTDAYGLNSQARNGAELAQA